MTENNDLQKRVALLEELLAEAKGHLDYVGWGRDSYERECSGDLEERIRAALPAAEAPRSLWSDFFIDAAYKPSNNRNTSCPVCRKRLRGPIGIEAHRAVMAH